jgi:hypothetical protein
VQRHHHEQHQVEVVRQPKHLSDTHNRPTESETQPADTLMTLYTYLYVPPVVVVKRFHYDFGGHIIIHHSQKQRRLGHGGEWT